MTRTLDKNQPTVVVVDDEMMILQIWERMLKSRFNVATFHEPAIAQRFLETERVDVAVIDLQMPGVNGLSLLEHIRKVQPEVETIMMSGAGTIPVAVESMHLGAFAFLCKPLTDWDEILDRVDVAVNRRRIRDAKHATAEADHSSTGELVGTSHSMVKLRAMIGQVGISDVPVLIHGETGTGKELVAKALHASSPRKSKAFVAVNCAGITPTLIDSELFGHERGAFTGADTSKKGLFEAANGGTLFLDEIGDMPMETQVRLLRVLQEGEIRPVGATSTRKIDVRIIAASNVNLDTAVRSGDFRQDLVYRLSVVKINVPALRDRSVDIPALAQAVLPTLRTFKEGTELSDEALFALSAYRWPGNVRELRNALEFACAMSPSGQLDICHLPPAIRAGRSRPQLETVHSWYDSSTSYLDLRTTAIHSFELRYLQGLLTIAKGNISEASRRSGIDRSNLRRMLKRHALCATSFCDAT